jgi:hypothetical protein
MVLKRLWLGLSTLILVSALHANLVLELNLKDLVTRLMKAQTSEERAAALRAIIEQLNLPGSKAEAAAIIRGNGDIRIPLLERIRPNTFTAFVAESTIVTDTCKDCAHALNDLGIDLNLDQTDALMLREASRQKPRIETYFKDYPKAQQTFESVLLQEKKLKQNGYLSLYHACQKSIYFKIYLDTKLMELVHGTRANYLKLRQPTDTYIPTENPVHTRNHFLKNGSECDHHSYDRYHLLCANHALTGNLGNWGECTAYFFADNSNITTPSIDLDKIFEQYNLAKYYEKYKAEIEAAQTFEMEGGVLLQLVFTPDLIDKTVYPARACGPKREIFNRSHPEEKIEKVSSILDALMQRPFNIMLADSETPNYLQWRVILTDDILLNPNSLEVIRGDFKVFAHSLEPKKLTEFHKKIDAIVAQIKKDAIANKDFWSACISVR